MPVQSIDKFTEFYKNLVQITNDKDLNNYYRGGGASTINDQRYYNAKYPHILAPPHEDHCLCSTYIKNQCFLYHKPSSQLIVVGRCCYKRFIPEENQKRYCETCAVQLKGNVEKLICNSCEKANKQRKHEAIVGKIREIKYCHCGDIALIIRSQLCLNCDLLQSIKFPIGKKYKDMPLVTIQHDKQYMKWFLENVTCCKNHDRIKYWFTKWLTKA
jgi:hypothetical protein